MGMETMDMKRAAGDYGFGRSHADPQREERVTGDFFKSCRL